MAKERFNFRLTLRKSGAKRSAVFEAARDEFRSALASALIDLRLIDRESPLVLEIGLPGKNKLSWAGLPENIYPGSVLRDVRWECSADLFEYLVRERNEKSPKSQRQSVGMAQ